MASINTGSPTRRASALYGGVVDIWNNTPNTTNPTRAQVAQFGDNYLLDSTPLLAERHARPYYYGYDTYHVQTDFEYAGLQRRSGRRLEVRYQGLHHPLLEQAVLSERRRPST